MGTDHQEAALDAALAESFPASDPIAISCPLAVASPPAKIVMLPWKRSSRRSLLYFGARRKTP
jgi:hypothetical protein